MSLEQQRRIRFVLTRHEQGAAFMAEVYGRLTGNPAGCLGTLGPGATNLITGVADSNMDRAPMLVLTGQGSSDRLHKESHQIMDVVHMFEPVTKWAHQPASRRRTSRRSCARPCASRGRRSPARRTSSFRRTSPRSTTRMRSAAHATRRFRRPDGR
jgi:thiamine pyrophosphate-dependent acetolactate synthase large subunit-like protein